MFDREDTAKYTPANIQSRDQAVTPLAIPLNELPLVLVISQCLVLSTVLLTAKSDQKTSNLVLAGFIGATGLGAMDALILWSPLFDPLTKSLPSLAYSGEVFFWLQGPMLYWYTRSLTEESFNPMQRKHSLHFLPAALFLVYLSSIYYSLPLGARSELATSHQLLYRMDFALVRGARHLHVLTYCAISLSIILQYRNKLKQTHSDLDAIDLTWLKIMIWGLMVTVVWGFALHIYAAYASSTETSISIPGDTLGFIWNCLVFVLINAIVFYGLSHPKVLLLRERDVERDTMNNAEEEPIKSKILQAMEERQLFLKKELTLDELAQDIRTSSRQVSETINQQFEQNFFEFVNRYRVMHAQSLLADQELGIQDVISMSGFNSKSAFHRFFKKISGMTPSQYRAHLASQSTE